MFTVALLVLFSLLCILLSGDGAWDNLTKPSRNALVFEGRPKDYGAFVLRREYSRRFILAFSGALTILSLVVVSSKLMMNDIVLSDPTRIMEPWVDVDLERIYEPPAPKPAQPETNTSAPSGGTTRTEILVVDTMTTPIDTGSTSLDPDTGSTAPRGPVPGPVGPIAPVGGSGGYTGTSPVKVDSTYLMPPIMPQFPGGDAALIEFIQKNTVYPEDALDQGVGEKIYVEFVVERDGSVSSVRIARGKHPSLNREAMRVVRAMPRWAPGRMGETAVRCRLVQPVNFAVRQ